MKKSWTQNVWISTVATTIVLLGLGAYFLNTEDFFSTSGKPDCVVRKSAIDIGSGSTKLLIGEVDLCARRFLEVIHSDSAKVDYQDSLLKNSSKISREAQDQGRAVLTHFLSVIADYQAEEPAVIATHAWREATNSQTFAEELRRELGINVHIIDQDVEAKLGFLSAVAVENAQPESVVVWDIGGGSQQISTLQKKGDRDLKAYLLPWGAVNFQTTALGVLQRSDQDQKNIQTPNPMSWGEVEILRDWLKKAIVEFKESLPDGELFEDKRTLGVGGVFRHSLGDRIGAADGKISQAALEGLLRKTHGWSDEEHESPYAPTQTTNVLLVLSLMEHFEIQEVTVVHSGLLEAVLLFGLPPEAL